MQKSVPLWDLNLVFPELMESPFEPLMTCSFLYLSWKMVFLVAIALARRVSEIRALHQNPVHGFFKGKVQLRLHPKGSFTVPQQSNCLSDDFLPKTTCDKKEQWLHSSDIRCTPSILHKKDQSVPEVHPTVCRGSR